MSTQARGRRLPLRWLIAAGTAAILALGLVWAWQSRDPADVVRVGDRRMGAPSIVHGADAQRSTAVMPFGVMSLQVSTGSSAGFGDDRITAPRGSRLVSISWSPRPLTTMPPVWQSATDAQRRDPGTDLTLVSDGRRYPIASDVAVTDASSRVLVVVRGRATNVRVESSFAGRRFAAVSAYSPASAGTTRAGGCPTQAAGTYSAVQCTIRTYRGPYVPGLGVAPQGKLWLVMYESTISRVREQVTRYSSGSTVARYDPTAAASVTARVNGGPPAMVSGDDRQTAFRGVALADRAWAVPAQDASSLRVRYRLGTALNRADSKWESAPATYQVDVSADVAHSAATEASAS